MDDLSYALVILVILVFMLFIMRIITFFLRNIALTRQLKQEARQRAGGNGNQGCGRNENANTNVRVAATVTPKSDAPPAYEDVVQNYIDAKQHLQAAEEGAVGGGIPLAVSTTTLETVLECGSSATDLNATTSATRPTTAPDPNHNHIA